MGYIYKVTNKANNKVYIGQTIQPIEKRFLQHLNSAKHNKGNCLMRGYAFHNALNKYGKESFILECLGEYPVEELDAMEIKEIQRHNSLAPNGYNITVGGGGVRGIKFTKESRERCSKHMRRRWDNMSEEDRKAWSEKYRKLFSGVPKSSEHRQKLSEWAKTRTGEKNSFYGKKHTEEVKEHLRKINLGNTFKQGIKVMCEKEGFKKVFDSYSDASYWLIENGFTKSKNRTSVTTTIKESVFTGKKRYGFVWSKIE